MKESDNVLLIFVKNPEAGVVKTRLAKTVGPVNALKVYEHLLRHTHDIAVPVEADKYVYYSKAVDEHDLFEGRTFQKQRQSGEQLGDKMLNAFQDAFDNGYEKVVIIGSDCYELDSAGLQAAFTALDQHEVVIGPAKDGGYYLLGMRTLYPQLFLDKKWSTENVMLDTILDLKAGEISYHLLPTLSDVDHEEDLGDLRKLIRK